MLHFQITESKYVFELVGKVIQNEVKYLKMVGKILQKIPKMNYLNPYQMRAAAFKEMVLEIMDQRLFEKVLFHYQSYKNKDSEAFEIFMIYY